VFCFSCLLGIANEQKKLYGTQFHPEVDLTENGMDMLHNFLFEIAGCSGNFTVQNRQQACINEIIEKVQKSKVLVRDNVYVCLVVCVSNETIFRLGISFTCDRTCFSS